MKINKVQKNRSVKIITASAAVVLVFVVTYIIFAHSSGYWPFNTEVGVKNTPTRDGSINLDPPTKQEKDASQDAKKQLAEGDYDKDPSTSSGSSISSTHKKEPVVVTISYADIFEGQLEIRSFVPSVIQGTGTCTATVAKSGSNSLTRTSSAFIDASSTICEPIHIPKSDLGSGIWTVEVKFSSPTHQGSSGVTEVEV